MWGWDKSALQRTYLMRGLDTRTHQSSTESCEGDGLPGQAGNDELGPSRSLLAQHAALTPIPLPESLAPAARATALAAPHGAAICRPKTNRPDAAPERRLRSPMALDSGETAAPRRPRAVRQSR